MSNSSTIYPTTFNATNTNFTILLPEEGGVWRFIIYTIQGFFMFTVNMTIVATVVRYTALNAEKQYVIVAGLAFGDAMNGFAYFFGGIYRTIIIMLDYRELATPWQCLYRVNLVWVWSDTMAQMMLLVVSIDRLLSVMMPLRYLWLRHTYALRFVATALVYSLASGAFGVVSSYLKEDVAKHSPMCYTFAATGVVWYVYYSTISIIFAFGSVLVYLVIGVIGRTYYRKKLAELMLSSHSSAAFKEEAQQQRKMTESLAISCVFTFFLVCIPYCVITILAVMAMDSLNELIAWLYIAANVNPILNVAIYLIRHREMRLGVRAFFAGRPMAPRLHLWLKKNARDTAAL